MVQNWDYAELSKAAKAAGGPEKYVEMLELTSKAAGKMEMLPLDWSCCCRGFVGDCGCH